MSRYLKTADMNWYKQRIIGVILLTLICFVVLFVRLFFLQVIKGDEYYRLSENNSIRLKRIEPFRGLIMDRKGKTLVDNRPSFDINIILKDAKPVDQTINRLSGYLRTPSAALLEKIDGQTGILAYKPIPLVPDVGRDTLAAVEVHQYDLPGIEVKVRPLRHYLNNTSAAHLIGYLGEVDSEELKSGRYPELRSGDLIGKLGVERAYDQYLRGKSGGRQVEVNATGQVVRVLNTVAAHPGHNLVLTIDRDVQLKAEELLKGVRGAAVGIDPSNGDILAMASSPSFDQNTFVSGLTHEQWQNLISNPLKPLTNRAVQGEYPPASTYKILTAIAGLEEKVIDEETEFCCPGYYRFGRRDYRCWKAGGHGCVDVVEAIAQSCDVFFYQVGLGVGVDRLAWYAKAFGLGSVTEINLPHEARGLIPTAAWKLRRFGIEWQEGETLSIAIGQGFNLVTPLQMAVMIATIANGGTRYQPQVVKRVETPEGKTVFETESKIAGKVPVSAKTMDLIQKGLWEVVHSDTGTAKGARFPGLQISGKTGTAQVISRKEEDFEEEEMLPGHLKAHAWFVAYAPRENPQIAVAVVVENGEHGSGTAAPIARELIKTYMLGDKIRQQAMIIANKKQGN
jgi:penicillin-binding protein 2